MDENNDERRQDSLTRIRQVQRQDMITYDKWDIQIKHDRQKRAIVEIENEGKDLWWFSSQKVTKIPSLL